MLLYPINISNTKLERSRNTRKVSRTNPQIRITQKVYNDQSEHSNHHSQRFDVFTVGRTLEPSFSGRITVKMACSNFPAAPYLRHQDFQTPLRVLSSNDELLPILAHRRPACHLYVAGGGNRPQR